MKTLVGVFATRLQAEQVQSVLLESGFKSGDVSLLDGDKDGDKQGGGAGGIGGREPSGESLGERIRQFFSGAGERGEAEHEAYTNAVERGRALLSVNTADDMIENTSEVLYRYGAADVEEDLSAARTAGSASLTGEARMQEAPYLTGRAGVRVYSHVAAMPTPSPAYAEGETDTGGRQLMGRADADFNFPSERRVVELTAMGEEAVVEKRSRVVEEVTIGKVGSDSTQQIHDSVRHTEVSVAEIQGNDNSI